MAKAVVDVLEAIEIDENHGHRGVLLACPVDSVLQPVAQQIAVRQARERVVVRLIFELLLIADHLGHVVDHANVMRRMPVRIRHRRDE